METIFPYFIAALFLGSMTAFLAYRRGKDPVLWFALGVLFGVFAIMFLYLSPYIFKETNEEGELGDRATATAVSGKEGTKKDLFEYTKPPERSAKEKTPELGDYSLHEWYYLDEEHDQHGPVDFDYLRLCFRENKINLESYVWTEGMENWLRVDEMEPLKKSLIEAADSYPS